eukprot:8554982-Heterocapsa_arctica.AAC.1
MGPDNNDRRPAGNSRYSNRFEDISKHPENLPVSLNLSNGGSPASHVVILPRTTTRARAREPQTAGEVPK